MLKILKWLGIVLFLGASIVGYRFGMAWQQDKGADVVSIEWSSPEVLIGNAVTLRCEVDLPWHREISSEVPTNFPDNLALQQSSCSLTAGPIQWNGYRRWTLQSTLVPVTATPVQGKQIVYPLAASARHTHPTLSAALPALNVSLPDFPETVLNPSERLKPDLDQAPENESKPATSSPESFPWTSFLLGLTTVLLFSFVAAKVASRKRRQAPAWDVALASINALQQSPPQNIRLFYLKLTDILKHYTAERFDCNANAESSTEYLNSVKQLPAIDTQQYQQLSDLFNMADAVKFAAAQPDSAVSEHSLSNARGFIDSTKPKESDRA